MPRSKYIRTRSTGQRKYKMPAKYKSWKMVGTISMRYGQPWKEEHSRYFSRGARLHYSTLWSVIRTVKQIRQNISQLSKSKKVLWQNIPGLDKIAMVLWRTGVTNELCFELSTSEGDSISGAREHPFPYSLGTQITEALRLFHSELLVPAFQDYIRHSQSKFAEMQGDAQKRYHPNRSQGKGMDSYCEPALYRDQNCGRSRQNLCAYHYNKNVPKLRKQLLRTIGCFVQF